MELSYYVMDPTGNITILVEGDVPADKRAAVAKELMKKEPTAEQVGFVGYAREKTTDPGINGECVEKDAEKNVDNVKYDVRLDMAGGEFCGNATMSAAVLFAERFGFNGQNADVIQANDPNPEDEDAAEGRNHDVLNRDKVADGEFCEVNVSSSGAEGIRKVRVEKLSDGRCRGTVEMPGPLSIGTRKLSFEEREYELPVVDFGGITHVIVEVSGETTGMTVTKEPTEQRKTERQEKQPETTESENTLEPTGVGFAVICENPKKVVMKWCEDLHAECLGLMIYDNREKTLVPYVYVPKAGTLFRESSCASGTTALGVYLAGIKYPPESACHTPGTNPAEDEYPTEGVNSARTDGKKDPAVYSISEPGGTLTVSVVPGEKYLLSGQVKINKHSMTAV